MSNRIIGGPGFEDLPTVDLTTIAEGQVNSQFKQAIEAVIADLQHDGKEPDAFREISMKIRIRLSGQYELEVIPETKVRVAAYAGSKSTAFLDRQRGVLRQSHPMQHELDLPEQPEASPEIGVDLMTGADNFRLVAPATDPKRR